jgi:hypothetical protein
MAIVEPLFTACQSLGPLLQSISDFLDRQHAMVERVRRDLVGGLKRPGKGRRGLTAPQVLRSLVLMRVKNGITASCASGSPTA